MKERQEDSVQQWDCPTQAKSGLEWATRPLQVSTLAGVQSSQYFRKPKPVGSYSEGEDCRLYNEELVRQICRQLNNAKDGRREGTRTPLPPTSSHPRKSGRSPNSNGVPQKEIPAGYQRRKGRQIRSL